MSEVSYIKCDSGGCNASVPKETHDVEGETLGWTKDELDSDFCPQCTANNEALLASQADEQDLALFGQAVSTEANKAIAEAKSLGLESEQKSEVAIHGPSFSKEKLDTALEEVVQSVRQQLKREKKPKKLIEETIRLLREQAARLKAKET